MDVGTGIGQWKIQEGKQINFPADEYKFKFNELIKIPEMKNENIFIEDEWDRESICKRFWLSMSRSSLRLNMLDVVRVP